MALRKRKGRKFRRKEGLTSNFRAKKGTLKKGGRNFKGRVIKGKAGNFYPVFKGKRARMLKIKGPLGNFGNFGFKRKGIYRGREGRALKG